MPVKLRSADLEKATARLKLAPRRAPYRVRVANGVALGYRRTEGSFGSWSVVIGDGAGNEQLRRFADADDREAANGKTILNFDQAMTEARKLARGEDEAGKLNQTLATVDTALTSYADTLRKRGARTTNATRPRHHLTATLLARPIALITEAELEGWRGDMLKEGLAPSSVNRVMNSLRAALTLADKTRVHIWRGGLKALPDATEANNVVIEDEAKAQQWVAESYALDHRLGLLTHVLGETGARPSQAVRLRVRDLITIDPAAPRLMMPKSGKGGTRHPGQRKVERYSVSISPELAALLKTAAKGRPSNAPLLLRKNGKPWNERRSVRSDYRRDVRTRRRRRSASIPMSTACTPSGIRRITRMLLAGTHTAIVAKAHDTSEAMIRKHYAAAILDYHRRDHAQDPAYAGTRAACREQRRRAALTVARVTDHPVIRKVSEIGRALADHPLMRRMHEYERRTCATIR